MQTCLLSGMVFLTAANLFGGTLTVIHTGTGSGSIDGVPFASTPFTINEQGDTDARISYPGGFSIDNAVASISIDGVGDFTFITATRVFVTNSLALVGFSRASATGNDLFNGPNNAAFGTWDLLSSIGPINGNGFLLQWTITPVLTSGGVLVFDSGASSSTFQATFSESDVPEPGSLVLLGVGLGVCLLRRRPARA